ncbi:MAG: 30S ribosomal protein S12 methylthiotransferase RimO [Saprospiraceae bacterium]|nr:30S ribosomal protein S12 methylthiotransferase RimO [Saprospiraceae bacterium]
MKTKRNGGKVSVVTLGCSKNLVDSENIVTQLRNGRLDAEHELPENEVDTVIVNTCGFIEAAKQESIDTILHYVDLKGRGQINKVYVTGCLSHRYKEELEQEIPEVDAYFGTMELPALLARFDVDYRHELIGERSILTPPHYSYLKISEGCNRTCAFCAIPLMRGNHQSRSIESLVEEAKSLVKRGVREILLIAQELTYYGLDLYRTRKLAELLERLAEVEGLHWIRLHYAYPSKFPREVLQVMAKHPNICNYLDMPLQHGSDAVLARMKRQITVAETEDLIQYARETVPNLALRTTMLVGFPGETEGEFDELCSFVERLRFNRLGVFEYSHEEGTSGALLKDDVKSELKERRAGRLMEIQRQISLEHNEALVGSHLKVLIDRKEGESYFGRTEYDSPEVDNEVILDATTDFVRLGDFANVEITDATEYDLYAKVIKS